MTLCARVAFFVALTALVACDDRDTSPTRPSAVASEITFALTPAAVLRSGSTVQVTARVRDSQGTNMVESAVTFTTDHGTLNRTTATTDASGFATVHVTASEAASVTATSGTSTGVVAIPAVDPFSVTIAPLHNVTVLVPAMLQVTVTPNSSVVSPPSPASVSLSCGPGRPAVAVTGATGLCTFAKSGSTVVSVSAAAANGWSVGSTTTILVNAATAVPVPPVVSPNPAPALSAKLGCTVGTGQQVFCNVESLTYGGSAIQIGNVIDVAWEWGDRDTSGGAATFQSHRYAQPGTYVLIVTVTAPTTDGTRSVQLSMANIVP
jgi:hypothetical protein